MGNYNDLKPFKFWCQKVLPLVYDDSLSYYELLCKVVDYLNKTMENVETLHSDVTNLHAAYEKLVSYVNNYFSSLDVQEEINNKLDDMASSGELYEIIRRYTDPLINEQNEKIDVLKSRMDTFASLPSGSTAGNAELADIRVGYDGVVYPSAGDAVREQVSELNYDVGNKINVNSNDFIYLSSELIKKKGAIDITNNTWINMYYHCVVDVCEDEQIKVLLNNDEYIIFLKDYETPTFDSNEHVSVVEIIKIKAGVDTELTVPKGARYVYAIYSMDDSFIQNNIVYIKKKNLQANVNSLYAKNAIYKEENFAIASNLGVIIQSENYKSAYIDVTDCKYFSILTNKNTYVIFTLDDKKENNSNVEAIGGNGYIVIANIENILKIPSDAKYAYVFIESKDGGNVGIRTIKLYKNPSVNYELYPTDFGAIYDGVTDCTNAIQKCLDIGGTIKFCGNGTALTGTLQINKSNTHIVLDEGFTIKLKDNTNFQLIKTPGSNYTFEDKRVYSEILNNISITGGTFDLNGNNQTRQFNWIVDNSGVQIVDCVNFKMENVTLKDATAFAFHGANLKQFAIRNIYIDGYGRLLDSDSVGWNNTDGLHFNGDCIDGIIENIKGVCADDFIGLNCAGDGDPNDGLARIRDGNCNNLIIRNIIVDQKNKGASAARAIRLMTCGDYTFDNVLIDGVYGIYYFTGVIGITAWKVGNGHFGNIQIKNVFAKSSYNESPIILVGAEGTNPYNAIVDCLMIDNVIINSTQIYQNNLVKVTEGSLVKKLIVNNVEVTKNGNFLMQLYTGHYEKIALSNVISDIDIPYADSMSNVICNSNWCNNIIYEDTVSTLHYLMSNTGNNIVTVSNCEKGHWYAGDAHDAVGYFRLKSDISLRGKYYIFSKSIPIALAPQSWSDGKFKQLMTNTPNIVNLDENFRAYFGDGVTDYSDDIISSTITDNKITIIKLD